MNVLFDIGHPAHVHLFKNFILYLQKEGLNVITVSRNKEVTEPLLDYYKIPFTSLSKPANSLPGMALELLERDRRIISIHRKNKIKLSFGTSVSIAHLTALYSVDSTICNEDDDDVVPLFTNITYPFASRIINPLGIRHSKWKEKRVFVPSYHELAYLHPNQFIPDKSVPESYGLKPNEYILVRQSALKAHHDSGIKGVESIKEKLEKLTQNQTVVYSHELKKANIKPWDLHQILAHSKLIISDSQTMTVEAAVLGVPSIRYNGFARKCSILDELEFTYGLTYAFEPGKDDEAFLKKTEQLLQLGKELMPVWSEKKEKLLTGKMDYNRYLITLFDDTLSKL